MVCVHSYGGLPGSEATKGLSKEEREKDGKKGGVVKMCYICAFAATEGLSLFEATGGPDPWIVLFKDTTQASNSAQIFYNDVPAPETVAHVAMLQRHAVGAFWSKATYNAFKHIDSTYLICENDNAIPLVAQEHMISQPGARFTVERCKASHSPFLSMPELTANFIRRSAGEKI